MLDDYGSDCGTKRTLDVKLTNTIKKDYMYRYIVTDNGSLVLLTPENMDKYVGKTVKMRSPMMCVGEKICNHCAGDLFYKLGIKNAGLTASRVATTLTRLNINFFVFPYRNIRVKNLSNCGELSLGFGY